MTDIKPPQKPDKEPLFNIPPLTFGIVLGLTAIHLVRSFSLPMNQTLVNALAFIPIAFTAQPLTQFYTLLGYGLLHFGWAHFLTNITGFMAFGSGTERLFGKAWLVFILCGGIVIGALGHWALSPQSLTPLGGASAGISALFGTLLIALTHTRRSYWSMVTVFVLTNIIVGFIGLPDRPGLGIAWQAHIFGFAFGLVAAYMRVRYLTMTVQKTS